MKILMIVPGGVHESGRICVIPALVALIRRLSRRHELTVVALRQYREPREYVLHDARVINLGYSGIPRLDAYLHRRWMKRIVKRMLRGFDVVHAFWLDEPGSLAVMAGRMLKIPVVLSLGGGELVSLPEIGYGGQAFVRGGFNPYAVQSTFLTDGHDPVDITIRKVSNNIIPITHIF